MCAWVCVRALCVRCVFVPFFISSDGLAFLLAQQFSTADADGSGQLSLDELRLFFANVGHPMTEHVRSRALASTASSAQGSQASSQDRSAAERCHVIRLRSRLLSERQAPPAVASGYHRACAARPCPFGLGRRR